MNRYPRWIYVTIAVALALGLLYTLPNFFGEAPAVQVSTARTTLKIDSTVLGRVEDALKKAGIQPTGVFLDINSVKVRFADTDTRSEEHTSELQSRSDLVCRLLLEKKKKKI